HGVTIDPEGIVNPERVGVAHQHRKEDVGAEVRHVVQRAGVQVACLPLGTYDAGIKERESISADLYPRPGAPVAGDDVGWIDDLDFVTQNPSPDAQQTVGRISTQFSVVRNAVREDIRDRNLESDREDIEAGEHVKAGRPARAWNATEIVRVEV